MAIRLVLADDRYFVREGIRRLLETQPGLELVAGCGDLDSLLGAVEAEKPDVVLTDMRMPPDRLDEGIRAAQRWAGARGLGSPVSVPIGRCRRRVPPGRAPSRRPSWRLPRRD